MNFDIKRVLLYMVFAFFAAQLWVAWQQEQSVVTAQQQVEQRQPANQDLPAISQDQSIPQTSKTKAAQSDSPNMQRTPATRLVWVETDVLRVAIDTRGGNIVRAQLLDFSKTLKRPEEPVEILVDDPAKLYIAQSGLLSDRGPDSNKGQGQFTVPANSYKLAAGAEQLTVPLSWRGQDGVMIHKKFTFKKNDYVVGLQYQIQNQSAQPWTGHFYTQLKRKDVTEEKQGMFYINPYRGASYSNPDNKIYNKLSFKKMGKSELDEKVTGGWLAMQQHYFLSAWVPPQDKNFSYYTKAPKGSDGDPLYYVLGMYSDTITVAAQQTQTVSSNLFVGPEKTKILKSVAPGLDMTVDYGLLWPISSLIMWMMQYINLVLNNWGWSILAVTFIIKLMFYHLSAKTYRSMAKQKELAPRLKQLRERHGDDKQAFSQAMIELYRKEKVNPLGGCLPMLVQIPVFIALYWALVESVEFRQAPFILWIHDLSAPDPLYILPLIMGGTMWLQQKLNPPPPDPMQQKMLMALPVVFTVLFLYFPAGLVLYFGTNNALSVLQQWYVMRSVGNGKKTSTAAA